jgi:hypothetical protein
LYHALQEGENELTATDAAWFGLIDEVIGSSDLPSMRLLAEFKKDLPPHLVDGSPAEAPLQALAETPPQPLESIGEA